MQCEGEKLLQRDTLAYHEIRETECRYDTVPGHEDHIHFLFPYAERAI